MSRIGLGVGGVQIHQEIWQNNGENKVACGQRCTYWSKWIELLRIANRLIDLIRACFNYLKCLPIFCLPCLSVFGDVKKNSIYDGEINPIMQKHGLV